MSQTIPAIFENGVIRPLEDVELSNGEKIEVILLKKRDVNPQHTREILKGLAGMPIEGETNEFSGKDHDEVLYPAD